MQKRRLRHYCALAGHMSVLPECKTLLPIESLVSILAHELSQVKDGGIQVGQAKKC